MTGTCSLRTNDNTRSVISQLSSKEWRGFFACQTSSIEQRSQSLTCSSAFCNINSCKRGLSWSWTVPPIQRTRRSGFSSRRTASPCRTGSASSVIRMVLADMKSERQQLLQFADLHLICGRAGNGCWKQHKVRSPEPAQMAFDEIPDFKIGHGGPLAGNHECSDSIFAIFFKTYAGVIDKRSHVHQAGIEVFEVDLFASPDDHIFLAS